MLLLLYGGVAGKQDRKLYSNFDTMASVIEFLYEPTIVVMPSQIYT